MSDHLLQTINDLEQDLKNKEQEIVGIKTTINYLCTKAKIPPRYSDEALQIRNTPIGEIRSDQYFGRPLATVVKEFLEHRRSLGLGAASLDEIHTALEKGGFQFEGEFSKRGLGIAISKNSQTFQKLPNGNIGLCAWYPNVKNGKKNSGEEKSTDQEKNQEVSIQNQTSS